ncbi:hypothetical protein QJQ45_017525 [Haematococcus lacustris]|nr:hypothetical protein QJQ45_017525 [Haematococcus lacustris]
MGTFFLRSFPTIQFPNPSPCLLTRRAGGGTMSLCARSRVPRTQPCVRFHASGFPSASPSAPLDSMRLPLLESAAGTTVEAWVRDRPWAQAVMRLQQHVHDEVCRTVEELQPQGTRHSGQGVLEVVGLPGKAVACLVLTHSGKQLINYKALSVTVLKDSQVIQSKSFMFSNMPQGTPFLECGVSGTEDQVLVAVMLSPRLSTLRRPEYTSKYYNHTPTSWASTLLTQQQGGQKEQRQQGAQQQQPPQETVKVGGDDRSEAPPVLPFTDLYARMTARAQPGKVTTVIKSVQAQQQQPQQQQGGGGAGLTSGGGVDPLTQPGPVVAAAPLYSWYQISQLSARIWAGHCAYFSLDPRNPEALEAWTEDLSAMIALWGSWVRADSQQPGLQPPLLEECREISAIRAQEIAGKGQETYAALAHSLFGAEGAGRLAGSMSGLDSLQGPPWWAQP